MRNPFKKPPLKPFSERLIRRRIFLILFSYFLLISIILGRTFELHLVDNTKLSRLAQNQYQKRVAVAPRRGTIFDVHHEELAVDMKVDSLYTNPKTLSDPGGVAGKLAPILGLETQKLKSLLSKDKKFVWIKRQLSDQESAKIEALQVPGLAMVKEYKRSYPNKNLAATTLGAVGFDSTALAGLEIFYDKNLKSVTKPLILDQDARGQSYSPYAFEEIEEPHNLVLTLDKTIQFISEKALAHAVTQSQAKSGIAVVMNNDTGEILAMASYPDFDPNQYSSYDLQNWRNRVVGDSFEPGSIFKAITAAAALESGRIDLEKKFDCEGGAYQVGKFTIHDHGNYGAMNLSDIIKVSSNIGSFKIAQFVGREGFSKTISQFGFGSKTGVDIPGEASGILAPSARWSEVQQGTIAFGQGISVTPMQIVNAYAAIANGGNLMKPFVVKKIIDSKGNVLQDNQPQVIRRVLSEENARKLTEILKGVIGEGGTGGAAQVEEYGVAGKTGTAQKVSEGQAGYAEGKFIASFVGYAPADDARITVLVSINEPKGNHFGGVVAAPAFREIIRQTLPYLRVPPRGNAAPIVLTKKDEVAPVPSKPLAKNPSLSTSPAKKIKGEVEGGRAKKEIQLASIAAAPAVLMEAANGTYRLPDFTGKSLREVLKDWQEEDLPLVIDGSGICRSQTPAAGQIIKKGVPIHLSFRPPG